MVLLVFFLVFNFLFESGALPILFYLETAWNLIGLEKLWLWIGVLRRIDFSLESPKKDVQTWLSCSFMGNTAFLHSG